MKERKTEDKKIKTEKRGNKKSVSPVVSTALLIIIVVILAVIIFIWASSFVEEAIEKEIAGVKKTADKFCTEVNLEASIVSGNLYVVNRGNVPIYQIRVERIKDGSSEITPQVVNLNGGGTFNAGLGDVGLTGVEGSGDKVIITPVLLGKAGKTKKTYICPESVGYELEL